MFTKPFFAVAIVSTILVVYCMLINFAPQSPIIYVIFSASPILCLWVTCTVIRHGIYHGKELADKEEWGYQDKGKEELWIL